eukprot:5297700-Alexandrium_andersonii.AAC.1
MPWIPTSVRSCGWTVSSQYFCGARALTRSPSPSNMLLIIGWCVLGGGAPRLLGLPYATLGP